MKTIATLIPGAEWLPLLAELALKATLVLLLTAIAAALLWRASAAARHLVWCVGVAGVLALPLFSTMLPVWEVPVLRARAEMAAGTPAPGNAAPAVVPQAPAATADAASAPAAAPAPAPRAWLPGLAAGLAAAGMLAGLLWLAAGFWGVSRIGRRAEVVKDPLWLATAHEAAEKLGLRRPVMLLRSGGAMMPATWGLLWPSVVIPSSADQWPQDRRRAVLAHELAHVKRFDCLTQAVAQLACVLFWWHPAVWYAARRLRVERERACDDLVLGAGTRASEYAAHLLEVARAHRAQWLAAPAMVSMARPSHLESRLLWVLDAARARGVPSAGATLLALLLGVLVVAPVAAMRPTQVAVRAAAGITVATAVHPFQGAVGEDRADEDGEKHGRKAKQAPPAGKDAAPLAGPLDGAGKPAPVAADTPRVRTRQDEQIEQIINMRAVGVTAEYIREMRALGWGDLTSEQLTGLRALGVTPAYVSALRSAGYTELDVDDVESMKAVGVTTAYMQEMNAAGYGRIDAGTLIDLRALGVTPAYVNAVNDLGLGRLSLEQIEEFRALGVTADFVREMRATLPGDRLGPGEITNLRALGVSPAYVRELAEVGITGLSARKLSDLRAHGVTAAYVRELREAGFSSSLSADQLVRLRASGVDRDLVRERTRDKPAP